MPEFNEEIREATLRMVREQYGARAAETLAAMSPPCTTTSHAGTRHPKRPPTDAYVCVADGRHHAATRHLPGECPAENVVPNPWEEGDTLLAMSLPDTGIRLSEQEVSGWRVQWTDYVANDWTETYAHGDLSAALARVAVLAAAVDNPDHPRDFLHVTEDEFAPAWRAALDLFLSPATTTDLPPTVEAEADPATDRPAATRDALVPGPNQPGSVGVTDESGRMVWGWKDGQAPGSQLVLAEVSTGHYEFTVLATTEEEATSLLRAAYVTHCEQTPGADPTLMAEAIRDDDVTYHHVAVGAVLRDGEPIR